MKSRRRLRLVKDVKTAEKEAQKHPLPEVRWNYSINPAKLSKKETELLEAHLKNCQQCRKEIKNNKSRADFFRRQKPPCDSTIKEEKQDAD